MARQGRLAAGPAVTDTVFKATVQQIYKAKPEDRAEVAERLAKDLAGRIDRLVLELRDTTPSRAADIGLVLELMGTQIVPQLIDLLKDENQYVQGAAIGALARTKSAAAETLVRMLRSADQREVGNASTVLRYLGKHAVEALAKACDPKSPDFSSTAIMLLAEIDASALEKFQGFLAEGLGSDDQYVSGAAIKAYSAIGPAAANELVGLMESANPYLQQNAINVLKKIGTGAIPELVSALGSDNQFLQQNAYQVLKAIGSPAVPALLDAAEGNNQARIANSRRLLGEIGHGGEGKRKWWPFAR